MSTLTTTSDAGEVARRMERIDEEALHAEREARFLRRKARLDADHTLDPRIKALYLDRTIWLSEDAAAELGVGTHRIFELRGGRTATRRQSPHPAAFPEMDTVEGYAYGVPIPGTEAGRVREWAVQRGTHSLNPDTGALVKKAPSHGRGRSERLVRSTPNATTSDVRAALDQIAARGLTIADHLVAAGRLRVQHPDATLRQLGEMLDPPVAKSTFASLLRQLVNHVTRAA